MVELAQPRLQVRIASPVIDHRRHEHPEGGDAEHQRGRQPPRVREGHPRQPGNRDRAGHDAQPRGQRVDQLFGARILESGGGHGCELSSRCPCPRGFLAARGLPGVRELALRQLHFAGEDALQVVRRDQVAVLPHVIGGARAHLHVAVGEPQALGANAQCAAGVRVDHGEGFEPVGVARGLFIGQQHDRNRSLERHLLFLPLGERRHDSVQRAAIEPRAGRGFASRGGAIFGADPLGAVQFAGNHARVLVLVIGVADELHGFQRLDLGRGARDGLVVGHDDVARGHARRGDFFLRGRAIVIESGQRERLADDHRTRFARASAGDDADHETSHIPHRKLLPAADNGFHRRSSPGERRVRETIAMQYTSKRPPHRGRFWLRLVAGIVGAVLMTATSAQAADRPFVIAHRGASGYVPEHTLAGYFIAIQQGADYVEPDLVFTRDGALVVRHENEIGGTTDVASHPEFAARKTTKSVDGAPLTGWFTEDFTLAELKTLRARERLPELRKANTRYDGAFAIPTFEEFLDLVDAANTQRAAQAQAAGLPPPPRIGIYPETKHPSYFAKAGFEFDKLMLEALTRHGYSKRSDPCWIQSFEVGNLKALRKKTDLPLVQLIEPSGQPFDFRL